MGFLDFVNMLKLSEIEDQQEEVLENQRKILSKKKSSRTNKVKCPYCKKHFKINEDVKK